MRKREGKREKRRKTRKVKGEKEITGLRHK
jgi:hypothetical protein